MAGYSATPLAMKLGIRTGFRVRVVNAPAHYRTLVAPLPEGARVSSRFRGPVDIVHAFCDRQATLAALLPVELRNITDDGAIWVSWPKKAAKVPTDMTEDVIRDIALPLGLVDVKVCAVDNVWSGLKLVIRREHRGMRRN